MKDIKNFIEELEKSKVYLTLSGNDIKIESFQSNLSDELLQRIKEQKDDIISCLRNAENRMNFFYLAKAPEAEFYPLSYGQKRLWTLGQLTDGNIAYNAHDLYEFSGNFNFEAFENSFIKLIKRHESLRTVFKVDGRGEVFQFVKGADDYHFNIVVKDFSSMAKPQLELEKLITQELVSPFDLANGPLIRATLVQIDAKRFVFVYIMHHIISDGWSRKVMIRDLLAFYNQITSGTKETLPALRIQYRDYAVWQQGKQKKGKLHEDRAYWLKRFSGELPVLNLPTDKQRPAIKTYNGGLVERYVSGDKLASIKKISKDSGATLYMTLLAAVEILLYRYTRHTDIIVGCPVAGRDHIDLENQIGFFVNTLALRTSLSGSDSYDTLLKKVMNLTMEAFDHQAFPFDELVDQVQAPVDISRHPIFNVMVALQNTDIGNFAGGIGLLSGLNVRLYDNNELVTSKFDLLFDFVEVNGQLLATIQYNSDLYHRETIERMSDHLANVIDAVLNDQTKKLDQIDFMGGTEHQETIIRFNNTRQVFPDDKSIIQLFDECATKNPDAIAVVFGNQSVTYSELNQASNRLANFLIGQAKVKQGDKLAILERRNHDYVIAILGILKAGCAYIPLETDAPDDRLKYIINEARVKVLVSDASLSKKVKQLLKTGAPVEHVLLVDSEELILLPNGEMSHGRSSWLACSQSDPGVSVPHDALAYVIFTSGTTGTPKGVKVRQRSVVRLVKGTNYISIDENDSVLSLSNFSFDGSVFDIFGALLNGATLVVTPQELLANPAAIDQIINDKGVTLFFVTTALFNALSDYEISGNTKLRSILFGGEQVSVPHVRKFIAQYPAIALLHVYGPTENTTFSTSYEIKYVPDSAVTIPIGSGIANTTCYVLNECRLPQPIGVPGELYLGGEGLADGYLNDDELTRVKFIPSPFENGKLLYGTGDLVRWRSEGVIEFIGRTDNQVKIRGFRIELNEIEHVLRVHPKAADAVVLVKYNSLDEKELVAFVAAAGGLHQEELENYAKASLPSYMIPLHWWIMDKLPLNANAKVDKAALIALSNERKSATQTTDLPKTEMELKIACIWKQILGLKAVSLRDNFFEQGGHSLKATKFVNQVNKDLGIQVDLRDLFTHTSLSDHVALVEKAAKVSFSGISRAKEAPCYALSPSQRRLWIVSQFKGGNVAYNISAKYEFNGRVDTPALARAFKSLIDRHEVLRTVFRPDDSGEVKQWIKSIHEFDVDLNYIDCSQNPHAEDEVKSRAQRDCEQSFDLSQGPLVSATLYQVAEERYVFIFVIHHIIADGWSVPVVIRELAEYYNAYRKGMMATVRPLKIQYRDFSEWQLKQLEDGKLSRDRQYWMDVFAGTLPVLEMPTDYSRPALKSFNGGEVIFEINRVTTDKLKSLVQAENSTLFMGILSLVNILLYRYTGQEDIVVGSPIAGREHADLDDQIGFYVNTIALRSRFSCEDSYRAVLKKIRQVTLDAYAHQSFPFDELIRDLNVTRKSSRQLLFDVMATLHNTESDKIDLWEHTMSGLSISHYKSVEHRNSKFDLNFDFRETDHGLFCMLEYDSDLFKKSTANRLVQHFLQILDQVLTHPDLSVSRVNYLNANEKNELLADFNANSIAFSEQTVVDLLEAQAQKTSEMLALVFNEKTLTYRELNSRANQMARFLESRDVKTGDLVFIIADRTEYSVISMLSILKCAAVYVPVDKSWPPARVNSVLKKYHAHHILTDDERIIAAFPQAIRLDDTLPLSEFSEDKLGKRIDYSLSSYIIFTSGSTGIPKGVVQTHLTLYNLIRWEIHRSGLLQGQHHLQFSSFSFDSSLNDALFVLATGGVLHVVDQSTRADFTKLREYILVNKVATVSMPYAALNVLFNESLLTDFGGHGIKNIISTGEQLYVTRGLREFLMHNPEVTLFNLYGPSETHVVTGVQYRFADGEIPIKATLGKPIDNSSIYILDSHKQLVPKGVEGEIYIGGSNLAVGYYDELEMTNSVFVVNPFNTDQRVYRTGDIGKWLDNGEIEYLGRKDNQVKINGFRVELDEIEIAMKLFPAIEDAVVIARTNETGSVSLAAYFVSKSDTSMDDIRGYMRILLPDYMIPASFVMVKEFPLTANGKIDKRALALIEGEELREEVGYVAPSNELEMTLVEIWTEILEVEKLGVRNNFFLLGGHSLKATVVLARVYVKFDVRISIETFFVNPTIESLAEELSRQLWIKKLPAEGESTMESLTF